MKYGLTSPPRREHWLRFSLPSLTVQEEEAPQELERILMRWVFTGMLLLLLVAVKALGLFK